MKGILFKEDMFKAILDGRKTETRRIIPDKELPPDDQEIHNELKEFLCNARARYKKNDTVYIKEPYFKTEDGYMYKDGSILTLKRDYFHQVVNIDFECKWENKMFMPAIAARYFIRIIDVKVFGIITK